MLGTDQPLKHLVAVLDNMPTAPSPPSAMPFPRVNAISANPSALALQIGFVWKQNSQTILVSKNKRARSERSQDITPSRDPDNWSWNTLPGILME